MDEFRSLTDEHATTLSTDTPEPSAPASNDPAATTVADIDASALNVATPVDQGQGRAFDVDSAARVESAQGVPPDVAQRPYDALQETPFDNTQDKPVGEAQDKRFDSAAVIPSKEAVPVYVAAPETAHEIVAGLGDADVGPPAPGATWRRVRQDIAAALQTLFSAAVYATLIVTFGFQIARVDGLSMAPTLEDHDRLVVNKLVYMLGDPRPGDIVMLYYPLNPDKMFVKRVIAKEGDSVRIVDGQVYVNDVPLKDDYIPPEFRSHDDWGPQVIPEGYYFVMGDHRNNSSDSRQWGMVPKKYIVGKVKLRWWPIQDARIF